MEQRYDAVVVGASLAGCATATLLAREGARVALVERRSDPAAFKRVCGHFIQPGAVPVLERLGVLDDVMAAGARRGRACAWTRYGWTRSDGGGRPPDALNLRRERLDPIVRAAAAATEGVTLLPGRIVVGADARDGWVRTREPKQGEAVLHTRLIVGADGRGSDTAKLLGVTTRTTRNDRFGYWAYFAGARPEPGVGVRIWFCEPDVGIVTGTDSGLTEFVAFPARERLAEYKRDPEAALRAFFATLPDAPSLAGCERVGPVVGRVDLTNEWRRPTGDGWALVGDAALAADPVGAVGCGWALQSASWLADAVGAPLAEGRGLGGALRRYRLRHGRELLGHFLATSGAARAGRASPVERLLMSAACHDTATSRRVAQFAARTIGPGRLVAPHALARAAAVNLRHAAVPPRPQRP